jgi:hypothetical protein
MNSNFMNMFAQMTEAEKLAFFNNAMNMAPPQSPQQLLESDARVWLKNILPLFSVESRFTNQLNNDSAYGFLYGLVQSGKSMSQIGIAFHDFVIKNRSTIWILQNSKSDEMQAVSNLNSLLGEFTKNKNSWAAFNIKRDRDEYPTVKFITMSEIKNGSKKTKKNPTLHEILTSAKPTILVVIAHTVQLLKLETACIELGDACNFNIIIDEVDTMEKAYNEPKKGTKRVYNFKSLKTHASSIIGVSATGFAELFGDEDLKAPEVFRLPIDHSYMGVDQFKWTDLTVPCEIGSKNSIFKDTELLPYMSSLVEKYPFGYAVNDRNGGNFTHPVVTLIKLTTNTAHFDEFLQYYEGMRDTKWCIISYSGDGIHLYHHSFVNAPFCITKKSTGDDVQSSPLMAGSGIVKFKDVEIGDVLEYLRKRGIEKFSHIAIIAGKLADRGINFTSNIYSINHRWHLSDMYFKPAKTTDCSALIQAMRPCGKYGDFLIPTVATFEKTRNDLLKAVAIQHRIVVECENYDIEEVKHPEDYSSVKNVVRTQMQFTQNEVPSKTLTKKVKCESDLMMARIINETDIDEFERLKKLFIKWSKIDNRSNISLFMKGLDPEKLYTLEEMKEYSSTYGLHIAILTNRTNNHGFGKIIKVSGNTCRLYNELIESFKANF